MRWNHLAFLLIPALSSAFVTHTIHWNSTNPVFETFDGAIDSPGYHEIAASPRDFIKFICPKKKSREYSVVYKVDEDDFSHCMISPEAEKVGECDGHTASFTIPLVNGASTEFIYFSTTSTGKIDGMYSKRLGLCLEKNMRLAVSLGLPETYPLQDVFNQIDLDSKGLVDSNLYLTEENSELHWKKNVFPAISADLDEMIRKSVKFDKNREMEPVPISNEFIIDKLEEMNNPDEQYIYPRSRLPFDDGFIQGSGSVSWILTLFFLFIRMIF